MKDHIAKVTITCAVIARDLEGAKADLAGCDKRAVEVFGHRALEVAMADLIEIAVVFDGLQTRCEVNLATLPPDADALDAPLGGAHVN
jgi:hypothetical protein